MASAHAYSILETFEMTDSEGETIRQIMIRNPWGSSTYTDEWSKDDSRWTDELVAQVPLGIDPRTSNADGVFIMPLSVFGDPDKQCLGGFQVAHNRDGEGYTDNWYDMENDSHFENWMYAGSNNETVS